VGAPTGPHRKVALVSAADPIEHVRDVARRVRFDHSGIEFSTTALREMSGGIAAHYGEKGFEQSGTLAQWLDPNAFDPRDEAPLALALEIVLAIDRASEDPSVRMEDCVAVAREVIDNEIAVREGSSRG